MRVAEPALEDGRKAPAVEPWMPPAAPRPRPRSRLRRALGRYGLFVALIVVLGAGRLFLHVWLTRYVNATLQKQADFRGECRDIDLNLWRGAYRINDLRLLKRAGDELEPFLDVERLDFSLQWSALLHGRLVGEISFFRPTVNFLLAPTPEQSQTAVDRGWQQTLLALFPFQIDTVEIVHGDLRFRDVRKEPVVDVELSELDVRVRNLTNIRKPEDRDEGEDELVASLEAVGRPLGQGAFWLIVHLDPFASEPTFNADLSLRGIDLVRLNDLLRAYANLDVERGTFHLFAELAAAQGRITGYVKPFFEDLNVVSFREVKDPASALHALWEAVVGAAAAALKNQPNGMLATRIPVEGRIENPDAGIVAAIGNVLRNAFVRALLPSVEGSVELEDAQKKQTAKEKQERSEDAKERERADTVGRKGP